MPTQEWKLSGALTISHRQPPPHSSLLEMSWQQAILKKTRLNSTDSAKHRLHRINKKSKKFLRSINRPENWSRRAGYENYGGSKIIFQLRTESLKFNKHRRLTSISNLPVKFTPILSLCSTLLKKFPHTDSIWQLLKNRIEQVLSN